jgi:transcriptional regulator with XRE-family HTH domain
MTKRPVFNAELGSYFATLREQRGWTQRQATELARRRGIQGIAKQTIWRIEQGKVKHPEAETLRAFSLLYSVPFDDLVGRYVQGQYGIEARLDREEVTTVEGFKPVRWLHSPIAAGRPLAVEPDDEADAWLAFQERWLRPFDRPICLTVGRDEQSMLPTIQPLDVVLIDQRLERRARPASGAIYAVNLAPLTGETGGTLKRIEISDDHLVIIADNADKTRYPTHAYDLAELELPRVLAGRVAWIGRNVGERKR